MGVKVRRGKFAITSLILCFSISSSVTYANADTKGKNGDSEVVCIDEPQSAAQKSKRHEIPRKLLKRGPRTIDLITNCGVITIRPQFGQAPVAVTFMTSLIQQKYFDETACHRLTTDVTSFIQCGDPTGTGLGDKVFTYQKENLPRPLGKYRQGVVAIQNQEGISSQFLIFYEDTTLAPNHSIWGRVIEGMDILEYIADGGVTGGGTDGKPIRTLVIERAIIR